jgi:hypothetical protein
VSPCNSSGQSGSTGYSEVESRSPLSDVLVEGQAFMNSESAV